VVSETASPRMAGAKARPLQMACVGFRSTTAADEPEIRALLQEAHGIAPGHPKFEHRHLCWKYWEPRAGWAGSRSYILTQDDRIGAHAAVVPAVCSFGNVRLNVLHVIDWAARAEARGAGNTLMRHIGTLCDAILTSSGSDRAWPLLPFLGFAETNTVVTQYARPIRPLLYLRAAEAPRWRLAARCVRNALWALRAPSGLPRERQARRVAAGEIAAARLPWPAPKYGTAVLERSPGVMSYWLQCPAARMELYAVENGAETEGYFVLAFVPGQARLADCWLDCDTPAAWEALVQLAVWQATRHTDVAELVAICSEPLLALALQRCGFHARGSRPLLVRVSHEPRFPAAGIRIQMLDDDAAYLHSGSRVFWA
jgi:hypothetical protein